MRTLREVASFYGLATDAPSFLAPFSCRLELGGSITGLGGIREGKVPLSEILGTKLNQTHAVGKVTLWKFTNELQLSSGKLLPSRSKLKVSNLRISGIC